MGIIDRRTFVSAGVAAAATAVVAMKSTSQSPSTTAGPNETAGVGIIGQGIRGKTLLPYFHNPEQGSTVRAICDPNEKTLGEQSAAFEKKYKTAVDAEKDLRKILDRKDIDAVVICAPNHWHTLAALWALQAGKHVYLEKPATQTMNEGKPLLDAVEKSGLVVQHGVQLRSAPAIQEAVQKLREGAIGDVYMARAIIFRRRENMGPRQVTPPPDYLDWDLWRGPSTEDEYIERLIDNGNWHHFWTFGGGDIMNQGVHELDMCLWGLGLESLPNQITAMGGNFLWKDAKEVPEILNANCLYAGQNKLVDIAVRNWCSNFEDDVFTGNVFYGSEGVMLISGYVRYKIIMGEGKDRKPGRWSDSGDPQGPHVANFLDAVKAGKPDAVNSPIRSGLVACNLGHLANVAFRTGEKVTYDPDSDRLMSPADGSTLLSRDYREGFEVPGAARTTS